MTMPTVTVEIAFTTDPGSASPSWTDVSAYQKAFVVHRGRPDEQSAFGPGQLQLTLSNEDRRFDPSYASSPYSPNVVPMRRVRVRATYNSITYDVFNGYVTNWQQIYHPPQSAECVVTASDAFKVLANIDLPSSVYEVEIRADTPVLWYRLGEPVGAAILTEQIAGRDATVNGTPTLGAAGLVAHDPDTAMMINPGGNDGATTLAGATVVSGYPMTLAAVVKTTDTAGGTVLNLLDADNNMVAQLTSDGYSALLAVYAGGTSQSTWSLSTIRDGNPHLIVGVWDAAGVLRVYVDGVASGATPTLTGTVQPAVKAWIGGGQAYSGGVVAGMSGTIDELAVFPAAVSPARIAAWASARATPWNGDGSGTRIGRVLDAAGWPATDRNIDTGVAVLQSADLGSTALAALQKINETEQGALFVTAAGLVRFIARDSLLKTPYTTSQGTFGDSGAELEFGDLRYEYDDRLIVNEVHVSRLGGVVQVAKDTTSQTRYLRRTKTVDGLLNVADSTSLDLANWIVNHYKDPVLRVTGMRLEPAAGNEATHFPHVLGRELMDRVTVLRRPQNLGAAISQATLIEGMTHTVTAAQWLTDWNLSPAETQIYWIVGVAGFSETGQTTRVAF